MPDFYATVRSCDLLDAITDDSGARFETAGALRGGRETFVTMKLPNSMVFDGIDGSKDRTDFYLAALNSHDGYQTFVLKRTVAKVLSIVIWSSFEGVFDVQHGALRCRVLRGGRGYLQSSA